MERLRHVVPSMEYMEQGIEYIQEHINVGSHINGSGGLDRYLDNYQGWLDKLEQDRMCIPNEQRVPAETYYLVNEQDRIIGMINIRLCLNERLMKCGGHIGYGIRPSERNKGYNKINLYLALLRCQKLGIKEVILDCDSTNLASSHTIEALGGIRIDEYYSSHEQCLAWRYIINVDESINNHKEIYEPKILKK
jgi:predicted acetyltransferase